jgi:hypothetical protein
MMERTYVRRIALNKVEAEISERVCIPLSSTKEAIARRNVTMAILEIISQRRRDVAFSGNVLSSFIWTQNSRLRSDEKLTENPPTGYFQFGKKSTRFMGTKDHRTRKSRLTGRSYISMIRNSETLSSPIPGFSGEPCSWIKAA